MRSDITDRDARAPGEGPVPVPDGFRIIAHRGASAYAPENTLPAFSRAFEMGTNEIELDVQLSSDGVPMVCHDRVLDRFGHHGVRVFETRAEVLQELDMGAWFSPEWKSVHMPTLDEVLARFGSQPVYHIEVKEPSQGIEERIFATVQARGLSDKTFITSFHYSSLRMIHNRWPAMRLGWLIRAPGISAERIGLAAHIGCSQLCPPAQGLSSEGVRSAKRLVEEVRAHHVRTMEDAWHVVQTGCDGLTVNHPDWLRRQSR